MGRIPIPGATTINNGTLQVGNGTSGSIAATSALTLGGGTFSLLGKNSGTTSQTIASLTTTANTSSSIALNPNGGTSTTLTITSNTPATGAGSSVNFNLSSGTTNASTSTLGNTLVAWNPALTNGLIGVGYTVTDAGGTGFATTSSGNVVRLADNGSSGLPLGTGASSGNYFVNSGYGTSNTGAAGSLVEALSSSVAANTVTVDTTGLASGANLALGTNLLTITSASGTSGGGFLFLGANPYTITASGAGGITTSTSKGIMTFNNLNSSTVTINAPILANGANPVTFLGTGNTVLGGANTYTGTTTINGGTLTITGTLGNTAVTLNAATLQLNGASAISQNTL